jgi:hypothetical protein
MEKVRRRSRLIGHCIIAAVVGLPVASIALITKGTARARIAVVLEMGGPSEPGTVTLATTPGMGLSPAERRLGADELNEYQEVTAPLAESTWLLLPETVYFCHTSPSWVRPRPRLFLALRFSDGDDTYYVGPGQVHGNGAWRLDAGDFERQPDEPGKAPLYILRLKAERWSPLVPE